MTTADTSREDLCDDEGCPHYGTPHVCISRAAPPSVEGLETTEKERAWFIKRADDAGRMSRDFDRLAAEVARLSANAVSDAAVIGRLNSGAELQALMKLNNELATDLSALRAPVEDGEVQDVIRRLERHFPEHECAADAIALLRRQARQIEEKDEALCLINERARLGCEKDGAHINPRTACEGIVAFAEAALSINAELRAAPKQPAT